MYPAQLAQYQANDIIKAISPACLRVELAGSLRRKCEMVHDVDIVAWPIYAVVEQTDIFGNLLATHISFPLLEAALRTLTLDLHLAEKIVRGSRQGIPFEIYLAEPDGSNFEALWQMRTGSAQFNITLAQRAQRLGLYYRAGYGIYNWQQNVRADDGTEEGIFKALLMERYPKPEERY